MNRYLNENFNRYSVRNISFVKCDVMKEVKWYGGWKRNEINYVLHRI